MFCKAIAVSAALSRRSPGDLQQQVVYIHMTNVSSQGKLTTTYGNAVDNGIQLQQLWV